MQEKNIWARIGLNACVYYTATVLFLLCLFTLFGMNTEGIQPVKLLAILPFSLLFSAANTLFREAKFSKGGRVVLHFLLSVGGAFLFLYLPNKQPDSRGWMMLLVLLLIYWLIMGIILVIGARVERVKRDSSQYQSVYRKK